MFQARYIARIALLAFIFNALLPFFAVYNVSENNVYAKQMSSLFGQKLLICTGNGFKWVRWQDLSNQKPHDAPDHQKCPLCYLAAHGFSAITPDAPMLAVMAYSYVPVAVTGHVFAHSSPLATPGSRAPPASFVS